VQGGGHEIARYFVEQGLLQSMIDNFVHQGRALEDFPQRGRILDDGEAIDMTMTAQGLLIAGEPSQAMALAREAIRLAPHFDLAYDLLGRAATAAGRIRDALEAHRSAAEMAPESLLYRLRHGRALLAAGDMSQAEIVLRAIADESPKWSPVQQALASIADRRGEQRAC
jgi:predicted Zn-dependent protease